MKTITLKVDYLRLLSEAKMIKTISEIKILLAEAAKILALDRVILYKKISQEKVIVEVIYSVFPDEEYSESDIILVNDNINVQEVVEKDIEVSSIPVEGVGEDFAIKVTDEYILAIDDINIARKVLEVEEELLLNLALSIRTSMKVRDLVVSNAYDHLTTCLNRGSLDKYLDYQLSPFNETIPYGKSISFVDIDHFGKFNKDYGHEMGDIVLRDVAIVLKEAIRDLGDVYRYGGEEFVIVYYESSLDYTEILCQRVREIESSPRQITISLGVSKYNDDLVSTLKKSNEALLLAKETGRDKVVEAW